MSEINIYKTTDISKILPKLVENIISQGKKIYIYCDNDEQEKELDYLLWSYNQLSFIPHGTTSDMYPSEQVVLLGKKLDYKSAAEILICAGIVDDVNSTTGQYEKILLFNHELPNKTYDMQINVVEQDSSGKWVKQKL
jgi:DNA polymerase IIIc chi subunit